MSKSIKTETSPSLNSAGKKSMILTIVDQGPIDLSGIKFRTKQEGDA